MLIYISLGFHSQRSTHKSGAFRKISVTSTRLVGSSLNVKRAITHTYPDNSGGESIVIPCGVGMALKAVSQEPLQTFELPGPGTISLPSLLNGRLHDSGLP